MDQLGDTIDIAREVVDVLALVDSSHHPVHRFVRIDIRSVRAAPLKVFQQLKAEVLILLSGPLSFFVEYGQKTVECGLSENPLAFRFEFGETHVSEHS